MEGCWTEFIPRDSTSGWPVLLEKGLAPGEMRAVPVLLHFIRTGRLCDDKEEAKGSGCDRGCSAFAWRRLCWVSGWACFNMPFARHACMWFRSCWLQVRAPVWQLYPKVTRKLRA